ncbi:MAG TPA: hypothetical protein VIU93_14490 [Gallionellaceae bacterium]
MQYAKVDFDKYAHEGKKMNVGKLFAVYIAIVLCAFSADSFANTLGSAPDNAVSIQGHWEGSWQYSDGSYSEKFSFDLDESGQKISGSGLDEKNVPAKVTGVRNGKSITLKIVPENGDAPIAFSGQVQTNVIRGIWVVGGSSGPWSAIKK